MQAPMGRSTHLDMTDRRNWTLFWRWSISILAAEIALAVALVTLAIGSRANTPPKAELSQLRQAQQQSPVAIRRACPSADLQKTQTL